MSVDQRAPDQEIDVAILELSDVVHKSGLVVIVGWAQLVYSLYFIGEPLRLGDGSNKPRVGGLQPDQSFDRDSWDVVSELRKSKTTIVE